MYMANVGKTTYFACVKDLQAWGYIRYRGHHAFQGNEYTLYVVPEISGIASPDTSELFTEPLTEIRSTVVQNPVNPEPQLTEKRSTVDQNPVNPEPRLTEKRSTVVRNPVNGCSDSGQPYIYKQLNNINHEREEKSNPAFIGQKENFLSDGNMEKSPAQYPTPTPVEFDASSAAAQPFANGFCPPTLQETKDAFAAKNFPVEEAEKFFHYYTAKGWTVGTGAPMSHLGSAIHNWMSKARQFRQNATHNPKPKRHDYLHDANDRKKDYSIPL